MTVINTSTAQLAAQVARQRQGLEWAQLQVGQTLTLRVLNQIAKGRFTATAGGEQHVVESKVNLNAGESIRARVTSIGDKVELQYLGPAEEAEGSGQSDAQALDASDPSSHSLQALQERYAVSLSRSEQQIVNALSRRATQPQVMTLGGLYLSKLGMPVDGQAMQALYAARAWQDQRLTPSAAAHDVSALVQAVGQGKAPALQQLAKLMGDSLDPTSTQKSSDAGEEEAGIAAQLFAQTEGSQSGSHDSQQRDQSDAQELYELARRLLNTQDLGSVAYHFGSLPIVVADQLIELDLVLFREHESAERTQGLKKLVMTLRTETLGRVQIVAQSVGSRLSVFVGAESERASGVLAEHGSEVRELVARLGWNVDSVAYRATPDPNRAAEAIVRHVLAAGTLDTVV